MIRELVRDTLKRDEGLRLKMYWDTAEPPRATVGYGHNLTDKPISLRAAQAILDDDIEDAIRDARTFHWFERLNAARQGVLVMLVFNMGLGTLRTFRKFLSAAEIDNHAEAANELRDSAWYVQVKGRGERLASTWETGLWTA